MSSFSRNRLAVKAFQKALAFAGAIQSLPDKITPPPMRLIQIGSLFWQSRVLYVAARLDLATLLGKQELGIADLATKAGCDPDALYRLLRMLISMGIFAEPEKGYIANNKTSEFLNEHHPQCVRPMILMHNSPEMTRPWTEELENGIRQGEVPFARVHGSELFDHMDHHPEFESLFARAMDSTEALIGDTFLTDFDWGRYTRLIDVGGSKGAKSITILKANPKLWAVVFDRPQVIEEARHFWQGKVDSSVLERIEFVAGDGLEAVPAAESGKDVYLLAAVLHGLGDGDAARMLQNIATAAGTYRTDIILAEAVLAEQGESLMLTAFDMQMLMGTKGRERTRREWQQLADAAGMAIEHIFDTRSLWKLLRLRPDGGD